MTVLQYSNPKSAEKANNVIAYSLTPTKNLLVETNLVLSLCPFPVFLSVDWKLLSKGLPEPNRTIISVLAANPKISGEFYAVNNRGIFCSIDSGISWKILDEYDDIRWPKEYLSQHPKALAVQDGT